MRGAVPTGHTAFAAFFLFSAAERSLPLLLAPFDAPAAALLTLALLAGTLATAGAFPTVQLARGAAVVLCAAAAAAPLPGADAIALAAGTAWLGGAAAFAGTRRLALGIAAGVALQPAAALLAQAPAANLSAAAAGVLLAFMVRTEEGAGRVQLERRGPALRRRSLVALGALLVLARLVRGSSAGATPDVPRAALILVVAGALAVSLAAALPAPWPRDRRLLAAACGLIAAALLGSTRLEGTAALAVLAGAHALVVVLAARAPLPAGQRRSALWVALAWGVWLAAGGVAAPFGPGLAAALGAAAAAGALILLPSPAMRPEPGTVP